MPGFSVSKALQHPKTLTTGPFAGLMLSLLSRRKMICNENDAVAVYTLYIGFISNVNHFINYLARSSFCIENYIFEKI